MKPNQKIVTIKLKNTKKNGGKQCEKETILWHSE